MSRRSNQHLIEQMRKELRAQESTRRLALMAAVELRDSLRHLVTLVPEPAVCEIEPLLEVSERLAQLLAESQVPHV